MNHVVMLTRKPEFIGNSASLLENLGFSVFEVPTIETVAVFDEEWFDQESSSEEDLEQREFFSNFDDFVFVSRNAVEHGLPLLDQYGGIRDNSRVMAVGPETAKALSVKGYDALYPSNGNGGQALMEVGDLASMTGRKVLILRGVKGLNWLAEEMTKRGAMVKQLDCYAQNLPEASIDVLEAGMQTYQQIDSVFLHSVQSVANLLSLVVDSPVNKNILFQARAIVGSQRIADYVTEKGWQGEVVIADSPSNKDMLLAHSRSV